MWYIKLKEYLLVAILLTWILGLTKGMSVFGTLNNTYSYCGHGTLCSKSENTSSCEFTSNDWISGEKMR